MDKHLQLLRSIPLFKELSDEQLSNVAELAVVRKFPARHVVFSQGDEARSLFAILLGNLKVTAPGPDGRDVLLNIMSAGEVFGEVALLDGGTRSATCTTMEHCELLEIDRAQFMALLEKSPAIGVKLLGVLSGRVRTLSQRSEDAAFLDVPGRLARTLLTLAKKLGERTPSSSKETCIMLRLSQTDLGDLIDATRESVNKHWTDWARQGLVRMQGDKMVISDIDSVRRLAQLSE